MPFFSLVVFVIFWLNFAYQVTAILGKMKKIRNQPLHANIYSAMETWMEGIRKVQARRKEEIVSSANRSNSGGSRAQEEKGETHVVFIFSEKLIFIVS